MLTLVIKEAKDEKNSFSKFPQVGRYNHTTMRQIKDCREDGNLVFFTCFLLPRKEKNNIFALFPFSAGNLSLYIDDFLLSSFFFWLFLFLSFSPHGMFFLLLHSPFWAHFIHKRNLKSNHLITAKANLIQHVHDIV